MPRLRLAFSSVLASIALGGIVGQGQTSSVPRRTLVSAFGPTGHRARYQPRPLTRTEHTGGAEAPVDSRGGASSRPHQRVRPALCARTRDRQVQGRRVGGLARLGDIERVADRLDGRTLGVAGLRYRADRRRRERRRRGPGISCPCRRRVRAGSLSSAPGLRAERPVLLDSVEPEAHRHGTRVGYSAGRRLGDYRRRARHGDCVPRRHAFLSPPGRSPSTRTEMSCRPAAEARRIPRSGT